MGPDLWQRLDRIFQDALELEGAERAAFLDSACGGDPDLRAEAESLIAADERLGNFMEDPTFTVVDGSFLLSRLDSWIGRRLGSYEVLREIGHGGMSTVYLAARRDQEYESLVAVKIVRALPGKDPAVDRFRQERQILAKLHHPWIARLYDGGTTSEGLPYFVMEYVEGVPVDRWCDERRATVGERLRLFRKICEAVQVAHQNLVVHRDIKPANILVTADGEPRLLDFGIAKLLEPEGFQQPAEATRTGLRPMTPNYASPEQIRGEAVTTASDVYSLGVLLYRLLTGRPPYLLDLRRPAEVESAILEKEPTRPSTAVVEPRPAGETGDDPATPDTIGRRRRTTPAKLRRRLAGDLDTIVEAALRKDPRRRYRSVEQLSGDIERHLRGLPVTARRETFGYLAGKYLRRHRIAVGFMLLLAAFGATSIYQAARIAGQRDRIEVEKDRAEGALTFLVDLFEVSDPRQNLGDTITAREILDRGAARIESELSGRPGVQITLLETIAGVYQGLGLYSQAQDLLSRSLALERRELGLDHPELGETLIALGATRDLQSDPRGAERLLRQGLSVLRAHPDAAPLAVAAGESSLGALLGKLGRHDEAAELLGTALGTRRRELGGDHSQVGASLFELCVLDFQRRLLDAAEESCRQALRIQRQVLGADHPDTVWTLDQLAEVVLNQDRWEEAEELTRESLASFRRLYRGAAHPHLSDALERMALLMRARDDLEATEDFLRQSLEMRIELLGEGHMKVAISRFNLAMLLQSRRDFEGADELFWQFLAAQRRHRPPDFHGQAHPLLGLARNRLEWDDPAAAEPLARQAVERRLGAFPRHSGLVLEAENVLAQCLIPLERYAEAEAILLENLRIFEAPAPPRERNRDKGRRETLRLLAELYRAQGDGEKAAEYAQRARDP